VVILVVVHRFIICHKCVNLHQIIFDSLVVEEGFNYALDLLQCE